jgi:site-specific recombinase XerD
MRTPINDIVCSALAALRSAGYKESTIVEWQKIFEQLRRFAAKNGERHYSRELGEAFQRQTSDERTNCICRYTHKRRMQCVRLFNDYLERGVWGFGTLTVSKKARPGTDVFRMIHQEYLDFLAYDRKHKNTIDSYRNVTCKYLVFLESRGILSLESAPPESICEFISEITATWSKGSLRTALGAIRSFFRFSGRDSLLAAADNMRPTRERKIISVLSDWETQRLRDVLADGDANIPKRDIAIALLCLLTGLRACDIVALRTSDIDWRVGIVSIVQAKTGNPLSLPMPPILGNAIADYIAYERPSREGGVLFLRQKSPHSRLTDHSACYALIRRVFEIAGISLDGRICGVRLLRHSAASKMLRAEVPLETISAILGHADHNSTEIYLATDDIRMRECCLRMPALPGSAEVSK